MIHAGVPPLVLKSYEIGFSLGSQGSFLTSLAKSSSGSISSSPSSGLPSIWVILPYNKILGVKWAHSLIHPISYVLGFGTDSSSSPTLSSISLWFSSYNLYSFLGVIVVENEILAI